MPSPMHGTSTFAMPSPPSKVSCGGPPKISDPGNGSHFDSPVLAKEGLVCSPKEVGHISSDSSSDEGGSGYTGSYLTSSETLRLTAWYLRNSC